MAKKKIDKAVERLRSMLELAKLDLTKKGYSASYRIVKNKEGTIDGEIVIEPVRGQKVNDAILDIEESVKPVSEFWLSVGARYDPLPKDEEKLYARWKGLTQTHSQYYPATKGKKTAREMTGGKKGRSKTMQFAFVAGRRIDERMSERKRRRKASEVILQFHWNPQVEKPERYK